MPDPTPAPEGNPGGAPPAPAAGAPPAGDAAKTFTQEDVNRMLGEAKRDSKDAGDKAGRAAALKEVEPELAELRQFKADAEAAKLTEDEKRQVELKAAQDAAAAEKARADALAVEGLRRDAIAEKAPELPAAYRRMVGGTTPEEIEQSVKAAAEAHDADSAEIVSEFARFLTSATPEQVVEQLGEELGKPLAARMLGRPASIGSPMQPTNGQPVVPPKAGSIRERMAELKDLPAHKRDEAWVGLMLKPE